MTHKRRTIDTTASDLSCEVEMKLSGQDKSDKTQRNFPFNQSTWETKEKGKHEIKQIQVR